MSGERSLNTTLFRLLNDCSPFMILLPLTFAEPPFFGTNISFPRSSENLHFTEHREGDIGLPNIYSKWLRCLPYSIALIAIRTQWKAHSLEKVR